MIRINKVNGFLVVSVVLAVICFSQQASAIDLCGVHISYPGAAIITGNSPCITVNSITVNSSGITTGHLVGDQNRTYGFHPDASIIPINATWQNQTSTYSQWLVTSPNPDTGLTVTGTELNNVFLNYLTAPQPDVWSFNNLTNTINVGSGKFVQLFLNASVPSPVPPPVFAISNYNQTAMTIHWTQVPRNNTDWDVFVAPNNNGTVTSWYHGNVSSTALKLVLGTGTTPYALACTPNNNNEESNGSKVYYGCTQDATHDRVENINIVSGTKTHEFTATFAGGTVRNADLVFFTKKELTYWIFTKTATTTVEYTASAGNVSQGNAQTAPQVYTSEKITWGDGFGRNMIKYNFNSTTPINPNNFNTGCELTYIPTNSTVTVNDIACDRSIPANVVRYTDGLAMSKVGNFYVNGTSQFLTSINANPYKLALTLSGPELGVASPFTTFLLHKNGINYMVVVTANTIYYTDVLNVVHEMNNFNRAVQPYTITEASTDSNYALPNPALQNYKLYGPATNSTLRGYGMFTLVSGYTAKLSSLESTTRTLDPQWTNQNTTNIPAISTNSSSLFPVILTVANAPTIAALKVTNPYTVIGGVENTWSIVRLDSTHTAEFDILAGQCPNIYVADTTVYPYLYLPQGNVCATGTNIKTVAFTNLLPLTFYQLTWGVTDIFTPATNALQTMVRHSTTPYTYTVVIYNSTGAPVLTQVFTGNSTVDTRNFNTTGISKPATLAVFGDGKQIYTSYLGSSLSLASVSTFFHQYMSYQGFDLLSFIPIVLAASFTRNTVGIGTAIVVVCIATLSFLSVTVVPDSVVIISTVVAVIGMIGYRSYAG